MAQFKLTPFSPTAPFQLEGEIFRRDDQLFIHYQLKGRISFLALEKDPKALGQRVNQLWEKTCFEVFLKKEGHKNYFEYNFSTAGEWNCFSLDDYRLNLKEVGAIDSSHVDLRAESLAQQLDLYASLDLSPLQLGDGPLVFGLATILRYKNEEKSYWALGHPANQDKPDFHHINNFQLKL